MYKNPIVIFLLISISNLAHGQNAIHDNKANVKGNDIYNSVDHHYANNDGIKIHYVTKGAGPLILFVHGFPDFWYSWRDQMVGLSTDYKVAAMDLRGYNLSDSPQGVENYTFGQLVTDLVAVIKDTGEESVYVVAHDWGAAIAWQLAAHHPELVDKLIILSINHPKAGDKKPPIPIAERKPSYADHFVSEEFYEQLTENWFSGWVKDPGAKLLYKKAFRKSDKVAMINYYRANYPTLENLKDPEYLNRNRDLPNIKMPVLLIHGKKDPYALTKAHNNTWNYVDNELSIEILPEAGHFIQQDESEKVTRLISSFLSKI
ncbi:MAG: alpha/beta hydrolase [Reichenbachiella sp.]|uniref:alpha/beta fold hydrolase n=1 Tax=Reichenbachiella sp. TaxID=2184521 RepID=UPI003266B427